MDNNELDNLSKLLEQRDFFGFERAIIQYIVADAQKNTEHNILWNQSSSSRNVPSFSAYDLVGQDLSTGSNIFIEIKAMIDRRPLLMTISSFRKARTIGYENDLYLYVAYDRKRKQISYFDISHLVKSTQVSIGEEMSQVLESPKDSISAFLPKIPAKKEKMVNRVEVVGSAGIPKTEKKNYWPLISKLVSISVAFTILAAVIVLNYLDLYELTNSRLILIGIITAVCLLLFVTEIKIKDWVYLSTVEPKDK